MDHEGSWGILGDLGGVLAGFRENSWGILGGLGGFWVDLGGIARNLEGF